MSDANDLMAPASPTRARRRGLRTGLAASMAAVLVLVASACVPSDFVKHTSGNPVLFSWFAPRDWLASYSTNGIDITDAIGSQYVGLAFAPISCASGSTQKQSATNFYNGMRANVRDLTGFSNWRTLSASTPRQLPASEYGANYWRQDITFSGTAPNGTAMRGEGSLDVQFVNFYPGCYYRNQIRIAPSSQFTAVVDRLRSTQSSISYFPPGA
ncbi:MAG TPA: hypothetical protein P5254_03685 [Aquihabitans sp.]|nr:hypothetical protein [Aquihabitans sp.]